MEKQHPSEWSRGGLKIRRKSLLLCVTGTFGDSRLNMTLLPASLSPSIRVEASSSVSSTAPYHLPIVDWTRGGPMQFSPGETLNWGREQRDGPPGRIPCSQNSYIRIGSYELPSLDEEARLVKNEAELRNSLTLFGLLVPCGLMLVLPEAQFLGSQSHP